MSADTELDAYLPSLADRAQNPTEETMTLTPNFSTAHCHISNLPKKKIRTTQQRPSLTPYSSSVTILFLCCPDDSEFLLSPNPHLPFASQLLRINLLPSNWPVILKTLIPKSPQSSILSHPVSDSPPLDTGDDSFLFKFSPQNLIVVCVDILCSFARFIPNNWILYATLNYSLKAFLGFIFVCFTVKNYN